MMKLKTMSILMCLMIFVTSCMEAATSSRAISSDSNSSLGPGTNGGNGAVGGGNDAIDNAEVIEQAVVEIRHLIEPKIDDSSDGGSYLKKLTIPKNYNGLLYIAGLNISTLVNDVIKVRFRFGTTNSPIDIDATVSTGAGLTPQTNVQVLILDLKAKPFQNVRLEYDLYDYNTYDFLGDGSVNPNEPVLVNRDKNLFCRGLNLEDDPTFEGSLSSGCNSANSVCKYSFAKIVDQGLVRNDGGVLTPITPTELQAQSGNTTYYEDSDPIKLSRCLNDNPTLYSNTFFYNTGKEFLSNFLTSHEINGDTYEYRGPYRKVNESIWQIAGAAQTSFFGLFEGTTLLGGPYGSKLFPIASKFNLLKDTEYLGSASPDGAKGLTFMASNGETTWMDGCNERAVSAANDFNGESIGSCNITSKIQIIRTDDDGNEEIIASQDVKLQIVKGADLNISGENVLLSSFQSCSSSNQCGSDECCIGKRCWDKSIVSQCVEDEPSYGLAQPGESCGSDYECSSLCCDKTSGRCAVHDTLQSPPALCSKPTGEKCIAKEYCQKVPVTRCFIINTGLDSQGGDTCALRCYTFEEFGDCEDGTCKPPIQPTLPQFDENDPNRCDNACEPPDFSNGYFDFTCGS
jgi:hypothetical protein